MAKKIGSKEIDEALERLSVLHYPPAEDSAEFNEIMQWYQHARKLQYKKGRAAAAGLICRLYIAHKQYSKLQPYLKEMMELCEENGKWTLMHADCLLMSIEAEAAMGRFDEAVVLSNIFLNGFVDSLPPVKAINGYVIICHLYQTRGWYIRALRVCHMGMTRKGEFQKAYNAAGLWINYAHTLCNVKQYNSALKEFLAIMKSKDLQLSPRAKAYCHYYLSEIYAIGFGNNDKCIAHFKKALQISKVHDLEANIASLLLGHAFSLNSLHRFSEALPLFENKVVNHVLKDNVTDYAALLNGQAWCLLNMNRPQDAWKQLKQVKELLKSTDDYTLQVNYFKACAFYYWKTGNEKLAIQNTALQQQAQEKANRIEFSMQLEQVNAMMELDKKQWELKEHRLKQEKTEEQLNHATQEKELLKAAIDQRNALINEFQAAIKKIEKADLKRAEIFEALNSKIISVKNSATEIGGYDLRHNDKYKKHSQLLAEIYPALSASEIKVASMLASGFSNKEIASISLTTTRNVENHRLQMRKKMQLKQGEDLIKKLITLLN